MEDLPLYGFKYNNEQDRVAITALLAAHGLDTNTQRQTYDTLAQYQIKDVELRPASLSLGKPQRWMLAFNTNLVGMNLPNGQALWFSKQNRPSGDSYTTMDLSVDRFAKMLKGGLYNDPVQYMKRLKSGLVNKTCYRQTKTLLTTMQVADSETQVSAGDYSMHRQTGRQYFIARDLQGYSDIKSPEHTNLFNVVDKQIDKVNQHPITKVAHLQVPEDVHLAQELVQDEVNFNSPTQQAQQMARQVGSRVSAALSNQSAMKTQTRPSLNPEASDVIRSGADVNAVNSNVARLNRIQQNQTQNQNVTKNEHNIRPQENPEAQGGADNGFDIDSAPKPAPESSQQSQGSKSFNLTTSKSTQQPKVTLEDSGSGMVSNDTQAHTNNLNDLMKTLNQAVPADKEVPGQAPKKNHAYVDDFAQALHSSEQSNNQRRQRRIEAQKSAEKEDEGPSL